MSEPYYPEKHKLGTCNEGQCRLCEEELEEEQERAVDQAILEKKEKQS